ncbi:uncharacterized protein LOC123271016 [Cotesia glomerata]|uniref:uncharacterized protein LOC123271016 n=1 Tax=Cotesia glomerata TaxID=32391 RepID=UPI001D0069BB|nr:uncharacterized protein LOC123271016 [Cotesia glomerata]
MRSKCLLLFLICLVGVTILFITVSNQHPAIQNLVTETHKQLRSFQENLKDVEEKRLVTDSKYLALLGLDKQTSSGATITLPTTQNNITIVTVLRPGNELNFYGFLKNVTHFLPNNNIVIYALSLGEDTLQNLRGYCNSTRCIIYTFDLDPFPNHIEDDRLHAYRPLVIQTALNTLGNILYMESNVRINNTDVVKYLLPKYGILTWSTKHAISSLTHPKMYEYFHMNAESFFFLPLIHASHIVIKNSFDVQEEIMLPWVQCALTRDCISPIGAQSVGCRFNKKPQYRYSGCHSYDESALNIVLGRYFNLDESRYISQERESCFVEIKPDEITEEYLLITRLNNTTEINLKNILVEP